MANENAGTTAATTEAPAVDAAPAATESGTPSGSDEVTTLRSRNAGLDAKITALTKASKEANDAAAAAAAKLADYESGKVQADEALRAQLTVVNAALETAKREASLARIEAKYPEAFGELGDAAAGMSEDKLASIEARLKGVAGESNRPPTPVGNNAARPVASANKTIEEMTLEELKAYGQATFANTKWADIVVAD